MEIEGFCPHFNNGAWESYRHGDDAYFKFLIQRGTNRMDDAERNGERVSALTEFFLCSIAPTHLSAVSMEIERNSYIQRRSIKHLQELNLVKSLAPKKRGEVKRAVFDIVACDLRNAPLYL